MGGRRRVRIRFKNREAGTRRQDGRDKEPHAPLGLAVHLVLCKGDVANVDLKSGLRRGGANVLVGGPLRGNAYQRGVKSTASLRADRLGDGPDRTEP